MILLSFFIKLINKFDLYKTALHTTIQLIYKMNTNLIITNSHQYDNSVIYIKYVWTIGAIVIFGMIIKDAINLLNEMRDFKQIIQHKYAELETKFSEIIKSVNKIN